MTQPEDKFQSAGQDPSWIDRVREFARAHPWRCVALVLALAIVVPATAVYAKYYRIVSRTLRGGPFANSANIYSAPRVIEPGSDITAEQIIAGLERAGYSRSEDNPKGWFAVRPGVVEVHPGPASYFRAEAAQIRLNKNGVAKLISLNGNTELRQYQLEPELVTNLVDGDREKRRLVTFREIPPVLVQAVVSAEDKRFFQHLGFDPFRLGKAAYVDLKSGSKEQGASTITMQLARGLWLDPEKRWRRKFSELMITMILEQRLSKEEIFEYYANQIYLGRRDSFSIHGFGEGARAFFAKDLSEITLPEAALLAGMIQRPSYFNPFRSPERAQERRNIVLRLMHENGYITAEQYAAAIAQPVKVSPRPPDTGDAPYFLALLNDELQSRLADRDEDGETNGALQVYSTLDPDLQRAAVEAVKAGMAKVDKIVRTKRIAKDGATPQVALLALDPHTGAVKALVGGRDYTKSQLNHAISMRQPGSIFKPFVYAAALSTPLDGGAKVFTPVSTVVDQPTRFQFGTQVYEPSNFGDHFYGTVTLKRALAKSMNLATVSLAEKVGYSRIVDLARKAGLNDRIQPTPAVALGAYEATPLEMAGAYTAFANGGEYVKPTFVTRVTSTDGTVVVEGSAETRRVLDPRVAFLMNQMLGEVMRSGTAAGVRSQGFKAPAAGKTGTSRDGWFAGYTPDLLCIVWVGFDDNRELDIEGAKSALPVWAEFMKRAIQYRPSKRQFDPPPPGIVAVSVDPYSGQLAGPYCSGQREYFIAGTEPRSQCQPRFDDFMQPGVMLTSGQEQHAIVPLTGAADRQIDMPRRTPRP